MSRRALISLTLGSLISASDAQDGFIDKRDNQHYSIVEINNIMWMTMNLSYSLPGSIANKDTTSGTGRYYTYAQALTVCPVGWRLPNQSDWNSLIKYSSNKSDYPWNKLNIQYAGTSEDGVNVSGVGSTGAYWMEWDNDKKSPVAIYFGRQEHFVMDPQRKYAHYRHSVRCVCDGNQFRSSSVQVLPSMFIGMWNSDGMSIEIEYYKVGLLVKYYPGNYDDPDPMKLEFVFRDGFIVNDEHGILYEYTSDGRIVSKRRPGYVSRGEEDPEDEGVVYSREQ